MPPRTRRPIASASLLAALCLPACGSGAGEGDAPPPQESLVLTSPEASVAISYPSFALEVRGKDGKPVLSSYGGDAVCGGVCATIDDPYHPAQSLPGWDGFVANEAPWRRASSVRVRAHDASSAERELRGPGVFAVLEVTVVGARVKLRLEARETEDASAANALNKTGLSFALPSDEHFFGMGERFGTVDHRGWQLYSWAEEVALGK